MQDIIALAGTSRMKIEATDEAIHMSGAPLILEPTDVVVRKMPEQPIGLRQIREGATLRAFAALTANKAARYGLGVESGFDVRFSWRPRAFEFTYTVIALLNLLWVAWRIVEGIPVHWFIILCAGAVAYVAVFVYRHRHFHVKDGMDFAVVALVERGSDKVLYTTSTGFPCDPAFIEAALEKNQMETAGSFYAKKHKCDKTNWHAHATGGALPRSGLLVDAIHAAFCLAFPIYDDEPEVRPSTAVSTATSTPFSMVVSDGGGI